MLGYAVLAVSGLLAVTSAGRVGQCGPLQQLTVKEQWNEVFGIGYHRIEFATAVWRA